MKLVVWVLGGLVGMILVAVLVLSAMSMRPGANQAKADVEIAAPAEQIWPWLVEGEKAKQWVSWLVEVRPAGKDTEIWVMEDKNNGGQRMELEGKLLKQDPPRSLTVSIKAAGGFTGENTYVLTDLGGGRTKVAMETRYKMEQMVSRLLEPLITPSARNKMASDLASLKTAVEKART